MDGISFQVGKGEALGLVGESGCGKSTTARLLVRLENPTAGTVRLGGEDVTTLGGRALRQVRRRIQLVFQDPYSSLNPRLTVGSALAEVLSVHGMKTPVGELLETVGLAAGLAGRYPPELSGGQRQRVGIARALAVNPEILVLDEPVSALDVSVRAEVMNLLSRLRTDLGLTYVFISHDLGMVRHLCDRIAVMYLGQIVEIGGWQQVSDAPAHPYAQCLRAAIPQPDPTSRRPAKVLAGDVPDPTAVPSGCRFHPRCPLVEDRCRTDEPELLAKAADHPVACHVVNR
ncbi:dipeptide ABC transporter ATP-binding protein [Fodinicola feengrottensis]|uniref:Dipeptide ABC transporter ATP-binding protein n=1 Tax=Fodinicola feengrottensis TaxID=435914 RepID=A0ABN2ITE3_9ACTN